MTEIGNGIKTLNFHQLNEQRLEKAYWIYDTRRHTHKDSESERDSFKYAIRDSFQHLFIIT